MERVIALASNWISLCSLSLCSLSFSLSLFTTPVAGVVHGFGLRGYASGTGANVSHDGTECLSLSISLSVSLSLT
jgi:hypothetical protein